MSNIFVDLFLQVRGTLGLFPKFADADLVNVISIVVRKGAHVTEYILLCTSISERHFGYPGVRGKMRKHRFFLYLLLGMHAATSFISCLYREEQGNLEMS